ncbi:MAG: MFS transporter [Porticoccaceae bacterium]
MSAPALPYWRLSGFYFCYFALLGGTYPYWSLYFQSIGFGSKEIGLLLAVPMATKIIAPNLWGWLADRSGRRLGIIRLGSLLALLCFLGITLSTKFWWLAAVMASYSLFWNAVLPQHEVITLSFLGDAPERYSRLRLWGSIGFIAAVVAAGYGFDHFGIRIFPLIGAGFLAGILVSSLLIPQPPPPSVRAGGRKSVWQIARQPAVMAFLAAGVLLQMAHGAYYSFFSIYLVDLGYSRSAVGLLWCVGVVAEIVIFMLMHRLLLQFGVRSILIASLVLAALRWFMIGNGADLLWLLIVAQCLHAFSFGTFHASAIDTLRRLFEPGAQGGGQALYSAVSLGVGGALGSYLAGEFWDWGAKLVFDGAGVICVVAAAIAWFGFRDQRLH